MGRNIYLIEGETLQPLQEKAYDSEELLQHLLADYPDLLAGEQMDERTPRRWLLVSREYGIPDEEAGSSRWALDHLFLDQEGVPTLVEVKRSSDTRIRRKVVGQMLDYAANAVRYWPVEDIRLLLENSSEDTQQQITDLLRVEYDDEEALTGFWQDVKTNLKAGRIRLVFVADQIPAELRRIVEFLNEQMDPAEVLAVEIRQYVGERIKTLVPKVIGQTAEAQQRKSAGTRSNVVKTESQQLLSDYWTELKKKYGNLSRDHTKSWNKVNLNRAGWFLEINRPTDKTELRVGLTLKNERYDGDAFFRGLKEDKRVIEQEVDYPLEWDFKPNSDRSWIGFVKEVDSIESKESWSEEHEWISDKLDRLYAAFYNRIQNIDTEKYRAE